MTTTPPLETESQARELARSAYAIEGRGGEQRRSAGRAAMRAITRDACDYARITPGAYEARFLDGLTGWEPEKSAVVANLIRRAFEAGRAARGGEAVKLLERVLFLRENGERPPGAPLDRPEAETWRGWERDAESFLRERLPGVTEGDAGTIQ